jgi:hypothetical protein
MVWHQTVSGNTPARTGMGLRENFFKRKIIGGLLEQL